MSLTTNKHGINHNTEAPSNAVVFEKYDGRFRDYEGKGMLLFFRKAIVAAGIVTVNMEIKPGAEVYVFPMIPITVATGNNVTFKAEDFHDGTSLANAEEIVVAVLANQADVKTAGQPH